ncbi:MAG TPA: hypothetical protein VFS43_44470 [Polyangiaceae bacterium]|nr:hypothetical protein [Polyangiaceae bacterium]
MTRPGELACAFVVEAARRAAGPRWSQGRRPEPLPCSSDDPAARLVAGVRLYRVDEPAARALVGWASGERPADLLDGVPEAAHVLALQARGRRCVSLLGEGTPTAPHADALAFAVHDLCHLEKFVDPEHHAGQVGFFALARGALGSPGWARAEARLDAAWRSGRDAVVADMNGSSVFLFAALKMRLKMAARRRLARDEGRPAPEGGPLDAREEAAFDETFGELLAAFGLGGELAHAARRLSARRDDAWAARAVLARFEDEGRGVLARLGCIA